MSHILAIRLSALGDAAILAPILREFNDSKVNITVAAPPMLEPLFLGIPGITFIGVEKKQNALDIYRQLKTIHFDSIADVHAINRVGQALLLLRLDAILHFKHLKIRHIHKGRFSRWLVLNHLSHKPRRGQPERYRDVFIKLGVKTSTIPTGYIEIKHTDSPVVGIAPFAQHKGKIWPIENMARLVKALDDLGIRTMLFGSKKEAPTLASMAEGCQNAKSIAGQLSFAEELEAIRNLTLMVTMDSANMHFASAVGTPVVSIWGATHPDFGFYGYRQNPDNALCANLKCQPCSAYGKKPCRYGDYRCMKQITPEMVVRKIQLLLNSEK